jgi:hypothetical protein
VASAIEKEAKNSAGISVSKYLKQAGTSPTSTM